MTEIPVAIKIFCHEKNTLMSGVPDLMNR